MARLLRIERCCECWHYTSDHKGPICGWYSTLVRRPRSYRTIPAWCPLEVAPKEDKRG